MDKAIGKERTVSTLQHYYKKQEVATRECLFALKFIVLSVDDNIIHKRKYHFFSGACLTYRNACIRKLHLNVLETQTYFSVVVFKVYKKYSIGGILVREICTRDQIHKLKSLARDTSSAFEISYKE